MNKSQVNNILKCLVLIDDIRRNRLNVSHSDQPHSHITPPAHAADLRDHDHDHEHSDRHDLLVAKITAMVVLFAATTLCGFVPFLLNRHFKWTERDGGNGRSSMVVKCLLYFGGGVLLCTTFLHLLPEVQEKVEGMIECGTIPTLNFPLAELLMCVGFFLMYFIEELLHTCLHRQSPKEDAVAAFERGHSVRNSYLVRGKKANDELSEASSCERGGSLKSCGSEAHNVTTLSVQDLIASDTDVQKFEKRSKCDCHYTQHDREHGAHEHEQRKHHSHSHLPQIDSDDIVASSLRGLFIVLALSLHELFEGMAIGLEGAASSVWFMFGAVSAHKLVLAFCVGVELIVARTRTALSLTYILTFAVVSPIGISIGILISSSDEAISQPGLSAVILQGFACGTLLYVVFFEILSKNHAGLWSYLSLLVGYLAMFGLQQLTFVGHGHSHGGSCSVSNEAMGHTSRLASIHATHFSADEAAVERQLQLFRQVAHDGPLAT